eukprot:592649-Pelagomonas_calceolata.AAC.3
MLMTFSCDKCKQLKTVGQVLVGGGVPYTLPIFFRHFAQPNACPIEFSGQDSPSHTLELCFLVVIDGSSILAPLMLLICEVLCTAEREGCGVKCWRFGHTVGTTWYILVTEAYDYKNMVRPCTQAAAALCPGAALCMSLQT